MSTGHTIATLGAFMLLTTILLNFYGMLGSTGDVISSGQDGILATTLTTSYMEIAQGLAYDEITDTSDIAIRNPLNLSLVLGPDGADEDSIHKFNDFDDLNNFVYEKEATGTNRRYKTSFKVQYVDPTNVEKTSAIRTFLKRMDLTTWRTYPPIKGQVDTLKFSLVMGYFHFD